MATMKFQKSIRTGSERWVQALYRRQQSACRWLVERTLYSRPPGGFRARHGAAAATKKNNTSWLVLLLSATFLGGCLQVKETYTLNPDRSGKVVYEATIETGGHALPGVGPTGDGAANSVAPGRDRALQGFVRQFLAESSGVDAWTDVTYENVVADTIHFKGTAYFS